MTIGHHVALGAVLIQDVDGLWVESFSVFLYWPSGSDNISLIAEQRTGHWWDDWGP